MPVKSIKVIFDTNIWISYLIGKRLTILRKYISNGSILIVTTDQLFEEIKLVTSREKLRKYFPQDHVDDLIDLLEIISLKFKLETSHSISRDSKDNFLFDLIDCSKADFLVTGDKDVLEQHSFKTAQIVTPYTFEKYIKLHFERD